MKGRNDSAEKLRDCEVILLCTRENDLTHAIREILPVSENAALIHFSGITGLEIFADIERPVGSIHFPFSITAHTEVTLKNKIVIIEGNTGGLQIIRKIFENFLLNMIEVKDDFHRALYHYSCTLAANLPFFLLLRSREIMRSLDLPVEISMQLFESAVKNFGVGKTAISGPLTRGDTDILEKHISSFTDAEEAEFYKAFIKYFRETDKDEDH